MNPNIEKLLKIISIQLVKLREEGDLDAMNTVKLEIDRLIKTDYAKLEKAINQKAFEALDGQEQAEYMGYLITYKTGSRFAMDNNKLRDYIYNNVFIDSQREEYNELSDKDQKDYMDDVVKNMFYSHQITQPSKPKLIKQ